MTLTYAKAKSGKFQTLLALTVILNLGMRRTIGARTIAVPFGGYKIQPNLRRNSKTLLKLKSWIVFFTFMMCDNSLYKAYLNLYRIRPSQRCALFFCAYYLQTVGL